MEPFAPFTLYNFGARWYDPNGQRFLTPDPFYSDHTMYGYANSSPYLLVDRDGCSAGWSLVIMMGLNEEIAKALFSDGRRFYGPPLHIGGVYWQSPMGIAAATPITFPSAPDVLPIQLADGPELVMPGLPSSFTQPPATAGSGSSQDFGFWDFYRSNVQASVMFAKYAYGIGSGNQYFGPTSSASKAMARSGVVQKGIAMYQTGQIKAGHSKTVNFDMPELLHSLQTPSLMDDFVGSVDFTIWPLEGGGYAIRLENSTDIASLMKFTAIGMEMMTGHDKGKYLLPTYKRHTSPVYLPLINSVVGIGIPGGTMKQRFDIIVR